MTRVDRRRFLQMAAALPFIPKRAHRSCILLSLTGGPSQLDTWDMKPEAPREVRGPFRPIRTNVAGMEISEIFPLMARRADRFALIRSVYHDGAADHESGLALLPAGGRVLPAKANFAANCRRARELVEAGEHLVTVNMFESVFHRTTWDSHGSKPFSTIADYASTVGPLFDRAYSGLLSDLEERGLLDSTLVVAMGEMGRTPRLNPQGGRDHWTKCWTAVLAGGGIQGGQIYGSSDAIGAEPRDNPVSLAAIASLICGNVDLRERAISQTAGKPVSRS